MEQRFTSCAQRLCVCASEHMKLISTLNGRYPDMGHHLANEMGGLWMYPVKLLDGFWMHFEDLDGLGNCWLAADNYIAHPYGNTFQFRQGLGPTPIQIDLHQLAPEEAAGLILKYDISNRSPFTKKIVLKFLVRTDLRPAWNTAFLGAPESGQDAIEYRQEQNAFHVKTEKQPWHVIFGGDTAAQKTDTGNLWGPEITAGKGISGQMTYSWTLEPEEKRTLYFYVAGSQVSEEDCWKQYGKLKDDPEKLWENKIHRMEKISRCAGLETEDKEFTEIYNWVKYNSDWLVQRTKIGRGITGGIPEYAWWFGCDSCYAVQGLLGMGELDLARDTLRLVLQASQKQVGNGRIAHEILGDGSVCHPGNTQETAHFIAVLWLYYQWTGDLELLREALPYLDKSVQWLLDQDDDGDLFPSGYGIIEIAGLNLELIDTAVYSAKAYEAYASIRKALGIQDGKNKEFTDLADRLTEKINTELWDEKAGLYCDAYACGKDIKEKLDSILCTTPETKREDVKQELEKKLENSSPLKEQGWILNKNWVITIPMEVEMASRRQAERALKRMHTAEFIGPYGMYLSGISQKEIMTINTGVMANAQVKYGYADRALELLKRMQSTFGRNMPGSISEMSPDYGCIVQAWTAYAMFVPVVTGFFGVRPEADRKRICLKPCMPFSWKEASLKNLSVLGGVLSLAYKRTDGKHTLIIENRTEYPVQMLCGNRAVLCPGKHCFVWE